MGHSVKRLALFWAVMLAGAAIGWIAQKLHAQSAPTLNTSQIRNLISFGTPSWCSIGPVLPPQGAACGAEGAGAIVQDPTGDTAYILLMGSAGAGLEWVKIAVAP